MLKQQATREIAFLHKTAEQDPEGKYCCVKLLTTFEDRDFLCMVFEPMHCNLKELIHKYGRGIGLHIKAVQLFAKKLLCALHYLQRLDILHADIKPENILINESKTTIRLADFGIAMPATETFLSPFLGSGYWRAPEVMLGLPYGYGIDIWASACSIFEMVTGKHLFPAASNNDLLMMQMEVKGAIPKKLLKKATFSRDHFDDQFNFLQKKKDPLTGKEYFKTVSVSKPVRDWKAELVEESSGEEKKKLLELHDLLENMLMLDPAKRFGVDDALKHPFFSE